MNLAVFDIDGTLLENEACENACYAAALREVLRLPALETDWSRYKHVSDGGIAVEAYRRQHGSAPSAGQLEATIDRFVALLEEAYRADGTALAPVRGAAALLPALVEAGWAVALATGAWRRAAEFKLTTAGVRSSNAPLASSEDGPARVRIIGAARARARLLHGVDGFARVVSIGDGVWDVAAARRLGLPFVGVGGGKRAERLKSAGAALVLGDFADTTSVIQALEEATPPHPGTAGSPWYSAG